MEVSAKLIVCLAVAALASCNERASDRASSTADASRSTPIPYRKVSESVLKVSRERWDVASSRILTPGDSLDGQVRALLERPDEPQRSEFRDADIPSRGEIVGALPKRWGTTRILLREVVDRVAATRADVKRWADGADLDDGLKHTLHDDAESVVAGMCATLADARAHYVADGGYANDLHFVFLNEDGDRPCMNAEMRKPYVTAAKRRGMASTTWSAGEAPSMIESRESAYLSDGGGFVVDANARVTVLGHRYSDADGATACRIQSARGTGWLPCAALVRKPVPGDG